jgi:hypothetical protein
MIYEQLKEKAQSLRSNGTGSSAAPLTPLHFVTCAAIAGGIAHQPPPPHPCHCSHLCVAGAASVMTNPLDLAKTRLQLFANTAGSSSVKGLPYNYSGLRHCFADIVRREGLAALMRGAGGGGDDDVDVDGNNHTFSHRCSRVLSNCSNKVICRTVAAAYFCSICNIFTTTKTLICNIFTTTKTLICNIFTTTKTLSLESIQRNNLTNACRRPQCHIRAA